jgi:type I restriction enzyme S subunit
MMVVEKEKYHSNGSLPVPKGWQLKSLGELGTFSKGVGITKEHLSSSGLPCIRYGEIYTTHDYFIKEFHSFISEEVAKESKPIHKNDVLFAGSGETLEDIGKAVAYIGNEEAYAGGDVIVFTPNGNMDSVFLSYFLNTDFANRQKRRLGQGHSVVHIYPFMLEGLKIFQPPQAEQKKIREILFTWNKAIELTEKLITAKEKQKRALTQQLLTGKKRLKRFSRGKWIKVSLGDVCHQIVDGTHFTPTYVEKGIPFYSVESVTNNDFINTKFISNEDHLDLIKRCKPERNDILMTKIGSIGDSTYIDWNINASIYVSLALLKVKQSFVNPKFLYHYTKTDEFKREVLKRSLLSAVPQKINLGDIQHVQINIPKLKTEQEEIERIFNAAEQEILNLKIISERLAYKKKGLMQELLTGKKRIKFKKGI